MFNKYSIIGQSLQAGVDLTKQTGLQLIKTPQDLAKQTAKQIKGQTGNQVEQLQEEMKKATSDGANDASVKKQHEEFIKGLYGPSVQNPEQSLQQKLPDSNIQGKSPEELQLIETLKQQLHNQVYYQPLITRPKTQEEVERPSERVERQEMEELQQEQKKEAEKPKVLENAERRIEAQRGASG